LLAFEVDIFDKKGPHVVAKAVSLEMAFECESRLDLLTQHFGNYAVKIAEDFHGELRFDTAIVDQIVDRVNESLTDAAAPIELIVVRRHGLGAERPLSQTPETGRRLPIYGL